MSNELEDIILTIDTREQNQKRIKAVEDWAQSHGAIVEHSALKLCDYRLIGEFRGVSVNIGIEAKSLSDFATSYSELSDKLARSYQLYDDVALFIESGNYTFTPDTDNFHAIIDNPAVRNGNADVLPLAVYENMLASFQREGVHVRQLRSEAHFPYTIAGLLISITKPIHTGLEIDTRSYKDFKEGYTKEYLNVLAKIPGLGYKKANKIIVNYPNIQWLASASEESLKAVLGIKTGQMVSEFLHCHELETDEWRNSYCRDGTEKDEPEKLICSACEEDKCTCVLPSNKLLVKNQQDDEGRLAFDAPAKNPVKCNFADPKNRAECKTPDHFKQHSSHPSGYKKVKPKLIGDDKIDEDTIILIKLGLLSYLEGFPEGRTAEEILTHFDCMNNEDSEVMLKCLKSLAIENKITSIHQGIFIISSHSGIIPKPITTPKPDDPRNLPPQNGAVKQATTVSNFPLVPAETHEDIGLDDKPLKCIVKCRACSQVIEPSQDDDTGFCQDPECIEARKKPVHAKNLIDSLKLYLKEPHTVPEIVQEFGVSSGYAFGSCMGGVKAGWLKKVTEQNGKTTFKRIKQ